MDSTVEVRESKGGVKRAQNSPRLEIFERSGMQVDLNYPGACWMDKRLVRVVAEEEVPGAVYL
jgi:hypothetical protein